MWKQIDTCGQHRQQKQPNQFETMACKGSKDEVALSRHQIEQLIQLYRTETDLWDTSSPNYYKKEARSEALARIQAGLQLQSEGLAMSVDQLQTKLHNLRGYYSKTLTKVIKSKRLGGMETYRSSWPHFDSLDAFLRPQIVPRSLPNNMILRVPEDVIEMDIKQEAEMKCDDNVLRHSNSMIVIPHHKSPISRCPPSRSPASRSSTSESPDQPPTGAMKRKASSLDHISLLSNSVSSNINTTKPSSASEDDPDSVFGRHIANELRNIQDPYIKAYIKVKIQSLIFESQYGSVLP